MTPASKQAIIEARRRFAAIIVQPAARIDLAHAALLIAKEEEPHFSVAHYLTQLDEMGAEARQMLASAQSETDNADSPVEIFNRFMFERLGFVGDSQNYYDPRNSLLSHVLDRRIGIPITLSIVYMEVGRRAGLRVEGVGLPGHFIVRVSNGSGDKDESVLVDPFNNRTFNREDCQEQLDTIYGGQVALAPQHLRAATTKEILVRVLRNLEAVYMKVRLYRKALAVSERIMMLAPQAIDERRTRGVALAQLGRLSEAIRELEAYVQLASAEADIPRVRQQLNSLKTRLAGLN